jgi:hypothetical protein
MYLPVFLFTQPRDQLKNAAPPPNSRKNHGKLRRKNIHLSTPLPRPVPPKNLSGNPNRNTRNPRPDSSKNPL